MHQKKPERIYFIGRTSSTGIQAGTHSSTSPRSEQDGGQGLTIVDDKDAPAVVMVFQVLPWYVLVEEVEGSVSPLPRHFLTDQHIQQTHRDHPQILLGVYTEPKQKQPVTRSYLCKQVSSVKTTQSHCVAGTEVFKLP